MKKITLILLLFGAFTFGIAGCGNSSTDSNVEHKGGDGHLADDTAHHEGDEHKHKH
ncbi:MAG: hypothetical protein Q7W13_00265 [Bacteroidia bacterium]|nr:hypothetical protein [Bacteroidia bacterium]